MVLSDFFGTKSSLKGVPLAGGSQQKGYRKRKTRMGEVGREEEAEKGREQKREQEREVVRELYTPGAAGRVSHLKVSIFMRVHAGAQLGLTWWKEPPRN